jgi:hypothetical protein
VALAVAACEADETPPEVAIAELPDSVRGAVVAALDTTPPEAEPGFLAARTGDPAPLTGEWPAKAGECSDPSSLHVVAASDSVGALLVVFYPAEGLRSARYPIVVAAGGPPSPGTALLGVQRIEYIGLAYRGGEGTVELSLTDRRASGVFRARLVDAISQRQVYWVGSFRDVPLEPWPRELCVTTHPVEPDSVR